MRQLADTMYIPTLVSLLDDRHDIARAALDALTTIVGRDVAIHEDDESPPTSPERIRRWQRWYAEQQNSRAEAKGETEER